MPAKKPTKSMDIQKPGETAPDTSGRPILVTNRPMLQDPMMVSDQAPAAEKSAEDAPAPAQPMASSAKTIEPEKEFTDATAKEKVSEEAPVEVPEEKPLEEAHDSLPDENSAAEDSAVVDAVIATANKGSGNSEAEKQADADAKRKQGVQVLVESKKYIVPIGQVSRRKHNQQVLTLIILIALAAIAFLAVTLGYIPSPVGPVKDAVKSLI